VFKTITGILNALKFITGSNAAEPYLMITNPLTFRNFWATLLHGAGAFSKQSQETIQWLCVLYQVEHTRYKGMCLRTPKSRDREHLSSNGFRYP